MNNTIKKIQYSLMITVGVLFLSTPPVAAQGRIMKQVASNDCGVVGAQPFFIKGDNYTMPEDIKGSKEAVTCNFGSKVIYAFNHMDIHADYQLEVVYLACLLYTSPSPRDLSTSRMPSSA